MTYRTALRRAQARNAELEQQLAAARGTHTVYLAQLRDVRADLAAMRVRLEFEARPLWRIAGQRLAAWLERKCR